MLCPQCAASRHESSRQMQGQCSVGQGLPPLHEARLVWLGLPNGRFQSRGNPGSPQRQRGAWWSSCGELRAIMHVSSRKRLSVTKWERGRHPVVALTSTFVTWRAYGILRILLSAHMSNASMREHWSFVVDHIAPIQHDRDYLSLVEAYFGIQQIGRAHV